MNKSDPADQGPSSTNVTDQGTASVNRAAQQDALDQARNNLSESYRWLEIGDYVKALEFIELGLTFVTEEDPKSRLLLADCLTQKAYVLGPTSSPDQVFIIANRGLELRRKEKAPDSLAFAINLRVLAEVWMARKEWKEAERLLLDAHRMLEHSLFRFTIERAFNLICLSKVKAGQGQVLTVSDYLREAIEISAELSSRDEVSCAAILAEIAHFYLDLGDHTNAQSLAALARSKFEASGSQHPGYASTLLVLGALRLDGCTPEKLCVEDLEIMISEMVAALSTLRISFGPAAPMLPGLTRNLAAMYVTLGMLFSRQTEPANAALNFQKAVDGFIQEDEYRLSALQHLANALEDAYGFAQSIDPRKKAVLLWEKGINAPSSAHHLEVLKLGLACLSSGRAKEAIIHAEICTTKMLVENRTDKEGLLMALDNLACLYQACGDSQKVFDSRKRKFELIARSVPPTDAKYVSALVDAVKQSVLANQFELFESELNATIVAHRTKLNSAEMAEQLTILLICSAEAHSDARFDSAKAAQLTLEAKKLFDLHQIRSCGLHRQILALLAEFYAEVEDYPRVISLLRESLSLYQESEAGIDNRLLKVQPLWRLANAQAQAREFADAAGNLEELITILEANPTPMGRNLLTTAKGNLAAAYGFTGRLTEAEELALQVGNAIRDAESAGAGDNIITRHKLALLSALVVLGKHAEAYAYYTDSLCRTRSALTATFDKSSERQQLLVAEMVNPLFMVVSLGFRLGIAPEALFGEILHTNGLVFRRQSFIRGLRDYPEFRQRIGQLESLYQQNTSKARLLSTDTDQLGNSFQIREQIEALEADLSRVSSVFSNDKTTAVLSFAEFQKQIPSDGAVIYFVQFSKLDNTGQNLSLRDTGNNSKGTAFGAFVVRADKPIIFRSLGMMKELKEALTRWQSSVLHSGSDGSAAAWISEQTAGKRLADLIWNPLRDSLSEEKIFFVSGDSTISSIPFGALPAVQSGRYLLESYNFVYLPVLHLLPAIFRKDQVLNPERILLVGNVNYSMGALGRGSKWLRKPYTMLTSACDWLWEQSALRKKSAGKSRDSRPSIQEIASLLSNESTRYGGARDFAPLPETGLEIEAVAKTCILRNIQFEKLEGIQATKANVCRSAEKSRWVHLATHGFYNRVRSEATDEQYSDLSAKIEAKYSSWSLSGVALTGANEATSEIVEDGVWTAAEAGLADLRGVELVVLSCCESAIGAANEGEGPLGLQRNFLLAGAHSVLGTLWKVNDRWTREVMCLFYENLWLKGMSKVEALRQSQIQIMQKTASLRERPGKDSARPLGSPYYWGAFLLSGDWR